jgi:hypothetical protein
MPRATSARAMYGPMPCEAPVRMALRPSMAHTPFQSIFKMILF